VQGSPFFLLPQLTGAYLRLISISGTITTSSLTGNRVPRVYIYDQDGEVVWGVESTQAITPLTTGNFNFLVDLGAPYNGASGFPADTLPNIIVPPGFKPAVFVVGYSAGDTYPLIVVDYEEYVVSPYEYSGLPLDRDDASTTG
jgi:hypothetical protein